MGPFGHLSAGFAVRAAAPRIPLAVLLSAAYLIEVAYFAFAAFNLDTPQMAPWSHSLVSGLILALLGGGLYTLIRKNPLDGLIVGGVVMSHWILDILVWDQLPFSPWGGMIPGLGIYGRMGFDLSQAGLNRVTLLAGGLDLALLVAGVVLWIVFRRHRRTRSFNIDC